MLRLAADEDLDNRIVLGIRRQNPSVDIATVREASLSGVPDPGVLRWAAREGRVLFTHDVNTMTYHAYRRANDGEPMPGLFAVPQSLPPGTVIEDMLLIAECSLDGEYEGQVRFLPLS